jgi:hypothetical protein
MPDFLLSFAVVVLWLYGAWTLLGVVIDWWLDRGPRRGGYLDLTEPRGRERLGIHKRGDHR